MIIHRSPLPDVEIPATTITAHVLRAAGDQPDRVALIDGPSGRSYTFAQLSDAIHRFAGGLVARGFQPGDVLALMAPNIPEYAIVFHGVSVAGGTVTTVNPTYGPDEVRHQLTDAGATMLITIGMFAETAAAAIEGTDVHEVMTLDGAEGTANALELLAADPIEQVPVDLHESIVVLPYSSGTTGLPKGVMLTHHNLVANAVQTEPCINLTDDEVILAFLPFFHIYGMQVLMNLQLSVGATVVTMPRFDLEMALGIVQEHKVTRFYAVPPVVLALAKHPLVEQYDLSSVIQVFSGAAPLGAELAAEAAARVGCEVVQGFGMTELSPVSHCTVEGDFRPGTLGITVPNTEMRIVDTESGEDQDVGGEGELLVRGPQVMKGYLNNEAATRKHDRRRRLAPHRRRRRARRARTRVDRRPGEGTDQVQGVPGAARRTRGAAGGPSQGGRRRRHRHPGRRGRRDPEGLHRRPGWRRPDRGRGTGLRRRARRVIQAGADGRSSSKKSQSQRAVKSSAAFCAMVDEKSEIYHPMWHNVGFRPLRMCAV